MRPIGVIAVLMVAKTIGLENECLVNQLAGSPAFCQFPFTYNGKSYSQCTDIDVLKGKFWCSTKVDLESREHAPTGGHWGYCPNESCSPIPCFVTEFGSGEEAECEFPFVYQNFSYSQCSSADIVKGSFWCSTKVDPETREHLGTDADGFWGHCPNEKCLEDQTDEADLESITETTTPQSYEPVLESETISCSVNEVGSNGQRAKCKFPFVFKNVTYFKCSDVDTAPGTFWCSTKVDPYSRQHIGSYGYYGYCPDENCTTDAIPKLNTSEVKASKDCIVDVTLGLTEDDLRPCIFPFIHRGEIFHGCTETHFQRAWCPTEVDPETGVASEDNIGWCTDPGCPYLNDKPASRLEPWVSYR